MDGHHNYPHQSHHLHQQQQEGLNYFQLQNHQYHVVPPRHDHPSHSSIRVHVDVSDRFPQWSQKETKELIAIRGELDETFMETKRNKQLWEVVATQMNDKGHNRSAEQCKCKWKNLITRYKGCEIEEAETMRQQFPFFNDLAKIMVARDQRTTWTTEADVVAGGAGTSKSKRKLALSSDEENAEAEETRIITSAKKKRKVVTKLGQQQGGGSLNVIEILGEFMSQQVKMEMQWREEFKARENERRVREFEWRKKMEAMENERLMMEREWREIEEQRRVREEARAEKRDVILTALLDKINRGKW